MRSDTAVIAVVPAMIGEFYKTADKNPVTVIFPAQVAGKSGCMLTDSISVFNKGKISVPVKGRSPGQFIKKLPVHFAILSTLSISLNHCITLLIFLSIIAIITGMRLKEVRKNER